MKIIFIKDASPHGRRGEVKEVSPGLASNFLIPKGFAQIATVEMQAKLAKENREKLAKIEKEKAKILALQADLEKRKFTVKVKVGDKGQVFGGVHEKEILEAVNTKMASSLEKTQIKILEPIKKLGEHTVQIDLGGHLITNITVLVEAKE